MLGEPEQTMALGPLISEISIFGLNKEFPSKS
jgi:hypothetical protein